jgi:hypothetical protein
MQRYKQRNFYIHDIGNKLKALYSYSTLVGYQFGKEVLFTTKKYSTTTSKQCTQYTNENGLTRYNISQDTLTTINNNIFIFASVLAKCKQGV